MNGTQISDTQRNNRTALTGHTIEALIVVVFMRADLSGESGVLDIFW